MGIAEFLSLASLLLALGGGIWHELLSLNCKMSGFASDFRHFKWRIFEIEKKIKNLDVGEKK